MARLPAHPTRPESKKAREAREAREGPEEYRKARALALLRGEPIPPKPQMTQPFKAAKVHVKRHLKNPPRSCLCYHSKTVDRARRGLARRLK